MAEDLLQADLKDAAQVRKGFSGGFPEGAGLEKDLGAVVSYGIEDAIPMLFFEMLIPLAMAAGNPIIVLSVFAITTTLPMLFFSVLLVYSVSRIGEFVHKLHVVERNMRILAALISILISLYYSRLWILTQILALSLKYGIL